MRWAMLLLLAGCAATPVECVTVKRVAPALPLDEPVLVHCDKLGQFLVCLPVSGLG